MKKVYTQKAMKEAFFVMATAHDKQLVRLAAAQKEISQAAFIRLAIREQARRELAAVNSHEPNGQPAT